MEAYCEAKRSFFQVVMLNGQALDGVVYEVYVGQGAREYADVVEGVLGVGQC